ncbi:MAG: hypothetical protein P4L51_14675 [Puia sp.]|nr:hypothetical protein [Puia sp.]
MDEQLLVQKIMSTMRAVTVASHTLGPKLCDVKMPVPGADEVLVRVECAPATTFERLQCFTKVFTPPLVLGVQASGTIVSAGEGVPAGAVNKKVVVFRYVDPGKIVEPGWKGFWCQYVVMKYEDVYVYSQQIPHSQACLMYGAPLTALGLFRDLVPKPGLGVLLSPGASTISKILMRLLRRIGVPVVSLVRSQTSVDVLLRLGQTAANIIRLGDPEIEKSVQTATKDIRRWVLVDAVGHDSIVKVFRAMPEGAEYILYGALGGVESISINPEVLVRDRKSIRGYYLSYGPEGAKKGIRSDLDVVDKDLKAGGEIFGTPVVKEYPMGDFMKAIEEQPAIASRGRGVLY